MENKKEKFSVNNYVVFKSGSECLEGRIKGIALDGVTEVFNIFCFATFTDFRVPSTDVLSNLSQDVKRKMKASPFAEIPNKTHFPPGLKNVLVVDKEWSADNRYELPHKTTVSAVGGHFRDFLINSSGIADSDEIVEVVKGFLMCFNMFFRRFLVYKTERTQIQLLKGEPSEFCGPVHLLRLIYFLQKETANYVKDAQTKSIILDYTIYLLDFMLLKYRDYFN